MMSVTTLNELAAKWSEFMLGSLWCTSLTLGLVAVVWLAIRKWSSPQLGYLLFLLVLLQLFVPVQVQLPNSVAQFFPTFAARQWSDWASADQQAAQREQRLADPALVKSQAADSAVPRTASRTVDLIASADTSTELRTERVASISPAGWIFLVWLAVVFLLLLRFVQVQSRASRRISRARPLGDAELPVSLHSLAREAKVRRRVAVVTADWVDSPAVWGVLRPTIILPEGIVGALDSEQLRCVLLHELAHVRRHDLVVVFAQRLVQIAFLFHPAIWITNWCIDQLRECACDDAALEDSGEARRHYAAGLLAIVERALRCPRAPHGALGVFKNRNSMRRRVLRILDERRRLSKRLSIGAISLLVVVAGIVLPRVQAHPTQSSPSQPRPAAGDTRVVVGRAVSSDGTPVAGARVFVGDDSLADTAVAPRALTDEGGRFTCELTRYEVDTNAPISVAVRGQVGDWVRSSDLPKNGDVELRFAPLGPPLRGRVVNLEGEPVRGAEIVVTHVGKARDEAAITAWTERCEQGQLNGIFDTLSRVKPQFLEISVEATTNQDGRFEIAGTARDMAVRLLVRGEGIAESVFYVVNRNGPEEGWHPKDPQRTQHGYFGGIYGANFEYAAGVPKAIVGTVRDRKTGKPIQGALVSCRTSDVTDENGAYRLEGIPKHRTGYSVVVSGRPGVPYFGSRKAAADTTGPGAIQLDFELERGVEIHGRLTDERTGSPVSARVRNYVPRSNENLDDYTTFGRPRVHLHEWGATDRSGRFQSLTIPGSSALVVQTTVRGRYDGVDIQKELRSRGIVELPSGESHAVVGINVDAADPTSLRRDIALPPPRDPNNVARHVISFETQTKGRFMSLVPRINAEMDSKKNDTAAGEAEGNQDKK